MKQETFKVDASGKEIKMAVSLICSSKCPGEIETAVIVEE